MYLLIIFPVLLALVIKDQSRFWGVSKVVAERARRFDGSYAKDIGEVYKNTTVRPAYEII